jgi:hypothetical protein
VAIATAHNGGRTIINAGLTSGARGFPLVNFFKNASYWSFVTNGSTIPVTPDFLDDNGYLQTFANGGVTTSTAVPTSAQRSGNYVFGTTTPNGRGTMVANGVSSTSGRAVFPAPADGAVTLSITAVDSSVNYPGNQGGPNAIYLCHEDDEASLLSDPSVVLFGALHMQKMAAARFGRIRMMVMQGSPFDGINQSTITNWDSRKPVNYAFWSTYQFRADAYCATCTNTGNAYEATAPTNWTATVGGKPANMQRVHVKFNANASAAPCTLKITGGAGGDTGDINILNSASGALGANQYPIGGSTNSLATLVYDPTLDAWIKQGGSNSGKTGIHNGWPPEVLLQYAAELGADPYWVTPHFACSAFPTDFVPELALMNKTYRDTYASWMHAVYESPNECWNIASAFSQTPYAINVSTALWGLTTTTHEWYGMATSFIGQMLAAVYGIGNLAKDSFTRTGYSMLAGAQTVGASAPTSPVANAPRLTAAAFVAQVPAAPSLTWSGGTINFTKTAPAASPGTNNLISDFVIANYFEPSLYGSTTGTPNETDLATAFAGGDLTAPTTYADSLNPATSSVTFILADEKVVWLDDDTRPAVDDRVHFSWTGTAPTGLSSASARIYFVKEVFPADKAFTISNTSGGAVVALSGSQVGEVLCCKSLDDQNPAAVAIRYQNWKAWVQTYGIKKLCGYEGWYSPDYTGGGTTDVDELRAASKMVTTMPSDVFGLMGVTLKDFEAFIGLTDETFSAAFPASFLFTGPSPSTNTWALLEDLYGDDSPGLQAIQKFNNRYRPKRLIATP